MKIAFILPKLANKGPILVAKDLIESLVDKAELIDVYYFDDICELDLNCNCHKISFFSTIDLSQYDVVHSHMLRPDLFVWLKRNRKHKQVKFISTLHQNIFDNLKADYNGLIAYWVEKIWLRALQSFDQVVLLTETMKMNYMQNFANKYPELSVIYNGRSVNNVQILSIEDHHIKILNEIRSSFKVIGSHCLVSKRKGLDQIIKALPNLPDYYFVHIGEGAEIDNLRSLAEELKVKDRCLFLGYHINAQRFLDFFDIYIMSSSSEGFPLALLEAGIKQLPVVCSDIQIFRELFNENEVVFFDLNNIKSLELAIIAAYNNKTELGQNVANTINDKYSVRAMADKYWDLYKN